MKIVKNYCATGISILLLFSLLCVPASANSAQTQWRGTDATGAIVADEDCPIVVEHELLTFDIGQFPDSYYREVSEYLAYSGSVTAEYTFYNPSDYNVEATLVFPFGAIPDYGLIRDRETDELLRYSDTEKYTIAVDGNTVDRTLRHTLALWGDQFELDKDMAKLHDGFMDDPFYSPDMTVTRYTYTPSNVDTETYNAANAAFILSADPIKTRVYMEGQNGGKLLDNAVQMEGWVDLDEPFVVNVIGEPLEQMPDWKFYENGACEDEIDGTMTLTNTETTTLKEFLLQDHDPASDILDYDWYNAMITAMHYFEWEYGAVSSTELGFDISDRLMRWYEYEISIGPGERIVNTVMAPIYPDINSRYEPPIFEYTYLLSPAQTWAEFGNLDIVVNTPYYMTVSGPEGFQYNNPGYELHLTGLPEGELTFTLCAEAEPKAPSAMGYVYPEVLLIGAAVLMAIVVVVVFARRGRKRSRGNDA